MSNIRLAEAAAPSTPATGKVVIYAKTDGLIYGKDDAGTETQLSNLLVEAAAPSTPATGTVVVYAKTDGLVYGKDDAGLETKLSNVAGITVPTPTTTTSGTYVDITIPAGTKHIIFSAYGVSTSGTSPIIVQLGDSGGIETGSYTTWYSTWNGAIYANTTDGWRFFHAPGATGVYYGTLTLTLVDSSTNSWEGVGASNNNTSFYVYSFGGGKDLSAEITTVRITTTGGSDTFDLGKINVATIG